MNKTALLGKTLNELKTIVSELGMPSFTAKQISEWLYKKRAFSIDEMTNISVRNRISLNERYELGRTLPVQTAASTDGTVKYLFKTSGGHFIETVYIPEEDRATLCVSSQVGCKMGCQFCMTGKQGFIAQLTTAEILNQIFSIPEAEKLTNLVFMGMGEPFDNTLPMLQSLEILTADYGYAWSPRRITVSSVGLIPGMKVFLEKSNCHLAISLHSPFAQNRLDLMPIEKSYPLSSVLDELRKHDFSKQRRVSFEYILFEGINDSMRDAVELVKILRGIDCRVNLIRYHTIPGVNLKGSGTEKMTFFRDYLTNNGVTATIRRSRGEDIDAACGMLSTLEKEKKESEV
ncbi:23S rRNA (adenine(2503)-C(2))-methyltransferase RlmN [Flavobacterium sp. UBA6031]|uniref:23S rRNA (adenine(2503)-C(2))-methyltransferase RlmN n=1 Tax=Flavobacterium sp. UBA6031 TaxID=1946551 RepID=UPI0025C4B267|nr:23S rRNA (adenine(2503)-C(2))-methyltransferase RlmN [Flavobacterium sp. UBA6031]